MLSSSVWLSIFFRDKTTPNSDFLSWVIIVIATLTWPLAVPLAIKARHNDRSNMAQTGELLEAIANQQYV